MHDNVKKINTITIMTPSTLLYSGEVKVNDGPYISFRNEEAFYDTMDDICSDRNISLLKEWFYTAADSLKTKDIIYPKIETPKSYDKMITIVIDVSKSEKLKNIKTITIQSGYLEEKQKKQGLSTLHWMSPVHAVVFAQGYKSRTFSNYNGINEYMKNLMNTPTENLFTVVDQRGQTMASIVARRQAGLRHWRTPATRGAYGMQH